MLLYGFSGSMSTTPDQVAYTRFSFELADMSHLNAVLAALRRVDGVFEAVRLTGTERRAQKVD